MGETRTNILETARTILVEEGYDSLTARRIGQELEMTDAGVHYHFETKVDLVVGLIEFLEAEFRERLEDHDGDPETQLAAIVADQFEQAEALRELTAPPGFQLLTVASAGNEELRLALVSYLEAYVDHVTAVLRDGIEVGVFETDDPERVAVFLASMTDAAAGRAALGLPLEALRESVVEYVLADVYVDEPPTLEVRSDGS
ncbi:TetR/AcrR family transcriptional regulator [Natrarchaeobius sp. A-rgal3]|uniref:TetR/AcrR family transcriptional regulator n=1 Tax=Natrarchaeobius versutus TaxID=1679078 RepID=UPI00350FD212